MCVLENQPVAMASVRNHTDWAAVHGGNKACHVHVHVDSIACQASDTVRNTHIHTHKFCSEAGCILTNLVVFWNVFVFFNYL